MRVLLHLTYIISTDSIGDVGLMDIYLDDSKACTPYFQVGYPDRFLFITKW